MNCFTRAIASPAGDGQKVMAFGPHLIRITAQDTGGAMGVLEATVPAGEGPPLHLHEREEEFFRVLSGRFAFWCADEMAVLEEGGCIALPRGIPHRFQNIGDKDGRLMVVVTPGGFEQFFPEIERRQPSGPEELVAIAAEFGLTFLSSGQANQAAA